jgi:hypothetical protein
VVDLPTLAAFPFVDYILRGEADETLPFFLEVLENSRDFSSVPGLTHRTPFGPARNRNAPVIEDLNSLPLPAFHLTGELADANSAPLELGRGCPYACTFCSTNDFFRRKFRLKSPRRVLAEMRSIACSYEIRTFDLVHDMFTVDRRRVVEFCECMLASGDDFVWFCSARTDSVDEELLALMAQSGCRGIFFGVESGSERMQRLIGKNLNLDWARRVIGFAEKYGIETTVSLISGFPEENWDDVRASLDMYMYSLRHPLSSPQFNLLAPLAETPIYSKYRDCLILDELCSDISHQGRKQNDLDRELIRRYPDIFPNFYLVPVPHLDRATLFELREFLLGIPAGARWLMSAVHRTNTGLLDVFAAWRQSRIHLRPGLGGWDLRAFYMREEALAEFVYFLRAHIEEAADPAVSCLIALHEAISRAKAASTSISGEEITANPFPTDIPVRASGVHSIELDWNVLGVIDSLKRGDSPPLVDRSQRFFRTEQDPHRYLRLLETQPFVASALQACNGFNDIDKFVEQVSRSFDGPPETCRLAAECLLKTLMSKHLIRIYRLTRSMKLVGCPREIATTDKF